MEANGVEGNDIVEVNGVMPGMLNGSEWCHAGNGKWKRMVS